MEKIKKCRLKSNLFIGLEERLIDVGIGTVALGFSTSLGLMTYPLVQSFFENIQTGNMSDTGHRLFYGIIMTGITALTAAYGIHRYKQAVEKK